MSADIDDSRFPANPTSGFVYPNGGIEYPQPGFSRRERAAIDLCVPESGTLWIDAMINEARRQRFAGQALAGLLADPYTSGDMETIARGAWLQADAMLAASKRAD